MTPLNSVFVAMTSYSSPSLPRNSNATNKPASSTTSSEVGGSVTKRLGNELMTLMMSSSPGISAFPKTDSNLFEWVGTIEGPAGTYYHNLTFKICITFPHNYPYVPPVIVFDPSTPCYHPNVDLQGAICLDILREQWSAIYSVHTILLSLQSLLGEPNNSSPLNVEASELWDRPDEFKAQLMRHCRPVMNPSS
ncbi:ubiquitin-conjugating enzyme E2 [Hysterangium stoloniferum]|nr:ubiquitin-conjugating enzyme E2 [Hysterangium stoloniferum]